VPIGAVRGTALPTTYHRARDLIRQLTSRLWRYLGYFWDFRAAWEPVPKMFLPRIARIHTNGMLTSRCCFSSRCHLKERLSGHG